MDPRLPPGPRAPSLIQGVAMWTRPLASLERARARYGKRFTVRFPFTPPFVILSDPEQIKEVYTAPPNVLHPGEGARVLQPLVGRYSVILLDEDAHMEQRKLLLPAFHGERMERLTDLVTSVAREEIATWGADRIELYPRLQTLTLEIILRAVFGLDKGPRLGALRAAIEALLPYGERPMSLVPPPTDQDRYRRTERWLDRAGPLRGLVAARDRVDELIYEQIAERRAELGGADRDDVLAMLLAARHEDGSEMSAEELRDELMTLLVAGHETTASTLAWGFERLSREPGPLARLTAEARESDEDAYLLATIQETLRRRPVLPNTAPRLVKQPVTIGGWEYPVGCSLVANAYLVHHDPDIYPEPYAFRPERFLDAKPGTYTWIPFGGGRRRCIGMSFAMLEMRIVLREVLRAYELSAPSAAHEPPSRRSITVRPSGGALVGLAPRSARVATPA